MRALHSRLARAAVGLPLALCLACSGGGGSGAPAAQTAVTVVSTSCPGGVGSFPSTTCSVLQINTPGNAPINAELRVIEPPPGPLVGTALLLAGGTGEEFYSSIPGGSELIQDLLDQGFRVVEFFWYGGWVAPGPSFIEKSARPAELVRWVRDNVHTVGPLCAVGLSGGATQLAYGLAAHDVEQYLDVVVLTSGPGKSRHDYLCLPPTAQWAAMCPSLVPTGVMQCGPPLCTASNEQECWITQVYPNAPELQAESILHPGADLDYPSTLVYMLLGTQDCSTAVPQALLYQSSLLSPSVLQFVDTPHAFQSTQAGRDAILQAITGSLPAPANPAAGPYVRFDVTVTDGERSASVHGETVRDE